MGKFRDSIKKWKEKRAREKKSREIRRKIKERKKNIREREEKIRKLEREAIRLEQRSNSRLKDAGIKYDAMKKEGPMWDHEKMKKREKARERARESWESVTKEPITHKEIRERAKSGELPEQIALREKNRDKYLEKLRRIRNEIEKKEKLEKGIEEIKEKAKRRGLMGYL